MTYHRIEMNNYSIDSIFDNDYRLYDTRINILQQEFKSVLMRSFSNFNETEDFRIMCDISAEANTLPPNLENMYRIWNHYIFPQSICIDIPENVCTRDIIQILNDKIKFHEFYKDSRKLESKDFYTYKYCVILAGFNIIYKILDKLLLGNHTYHPISFICLNDRISDYSIYGEFHILYQINIPLRFFLDLVYNIPIFEHTQESEMSYSYFWYKIWNIYVNIVDFIRKKQPYLIEEYLNRSNQKDSVNKKQIISMIETINLNDNTLNSIYNIIEFN